MTTRAPFSQKPWQPVALTSTLAQPLPGDLALERLIDVDGIAGAAARVGADADGYPAGRPLAEDFLLESIEALERAKLVEFQGRTSCPAYALER